MGSSIYFGLEKSIDNNKWEKIENKQIEDFYSLSLRDYFGHTSDLKYTKIYNRGNVKIPYIDEDTKEKEYTEQDQSYIYVSDLNYIIVDLKEKIKDCKKDLKIYKKRFENSESIKVWVSYLNNLILANKLNDNTKNEDIYKKIEETQKKLLETNEENSDYWYVKNDFDESLKDYEYAISNLKELQTIINQIIEDNNYDSHKIILTYYISY
jgi:tetratricopeptide (TPR) repeat protein